MITKEDIEFSKLSYTNKDFASIYPDLLDLAKQLTDVWNPAESNESDPGVVLLKEGAFIADHNNYNIDKNVLECFLPSATQETSVRNLVEMNGYVPRYYISAKGKINFEYTIPEGADSNTPKTLMINPFTLKVTNEDGSVTYTQGPDWLIINEDGKPQRTIDFIEGTLSTLTVNGVETITLDNIDDNNRLYFPVRQVAENGIFISNVLPSGEQNYDFWDRTDYIYTQPLDTKCYKLDYDSSMGLPYIEFPSDIANLIESGLSVKYIVSSGANGNILSGKLTKISSPANLIDNSTGEGIKVPTDYFSVSNPDSMLNGKNPETIDEMYQSFKKIVHTFETLVTCKDFQDAIYMMSDENKTRYVGNDIVTDIKTDYNKSIRVVSYDSYGPFIKNIALTNGLGRLKFQSEKPEEPEIGDMIIEDGIIKWYTYNKNDEEPVAEWQPLEEISYDDFVRASEAITPFDICVYALKAFSMADYTMYYPWKAHAKSFEPIINDESGKETINIIENKLDELKCINHQFTTPNAGDIICFKNYVPLWVTVIPYTKVSVQEKNAIFDNIYKALSNNFNSGMLDFGQELNYDTVYNVIVNSDDRIKSIRLEDFKYETYALVRGSLPQDNSENRSNEWTEYKLLNDELVGNYLFVDLVAKNVLAGRLALFDIDDNFNREYGQVNVKEYHSVKKISSEVTIPVENLTYQTEEDSEGESEIIPTEYALLENEYIQIAWPNYYTDITYPQYVYFRFVSQNENGVPADTEYVLGSDESLTLVWTQNGATQRKTYGQNKVIKPNFHLLPTSDNAYYQKTMPDGTSKPFDILRANEQIEHKELLRTILNSDAIPVYWITQGNRQLFYNKENPSEVVDTEILNSGEYFIYSNVQKDAMVIFGAGTKLHLDAVDPDDSWSLIPNSDIDTINDEGFNAGLNWVYKNFTNYPLWIDEMNLLTLSFGDTIHIDLDESSELNDINNTWQKFIGTIEYKINAGGLNESEATVKTNDEFYIRSRLDMTSDKYHRQELFRNQTIKGELEDGSYFEIVPDSVDDPERIPDSERKYYQVNTAVDILGDTETVITDYLANYNLDIREFKVQEPIVFDTDNPTNSNTITTADGNLYITLDYDNGEASIPFSYINEFNTLEPNIKQYIFPIYIDANSIPKESYVPIYVWVTGDLQEDSENYISYELTHYGRPNIDKHIEDSERADGLILDEPGLHLLKLELNINNSESSEQDDIDINLNSDLVLHVGWVSSNRVAENIVVKQFKIIGGLNSSIPEEYTSLDEVTARIEELMKDSNDSSATPYLTYDPEFSKALQNEDLSDPNTLWDVNNVANPFTIAQIAMEYMCTFEDEKTGKIGTMDIIKSMKDYTE